MKQFVFPRPSRVFADQRAQRPFWTRASVAITACLLLMGGGARPVYASYIVVTAIQTNVGSSPVAEANYNQGQVGSQFNAVGGGTVGGTIDSTGTLTAAYDQGTILGTQAGTVYAHADLSTGALGASISSPLGATLVNDSATASYSDLLHFVIQGAGLNTVTDIGVQFSLSGSLANGPDGGSGFGGTVASSFGIAQAGWGGAGVVTNIFDGLHMSPCADFSACIASQTFSYPGGGAGGWVTYSFTSDTPGSIIFNGVFALHGATADVPISNYISLFGAGGQINEDYSHTSIVGLSLPGGVSYTSDSGVFDTGGASVPEPGSLGLLGTALLGMGIARWRWTKRRR